VYHTLTLLLMRQAIADRAGQSRAGEAYIYISGSYLLRLGHLPALLHEQLSLLRAGTRTRLGHVRRTRGHAETDTERHTEIDTVADTDTDTDTGTGTDTDKSELILLGLYSIYCRKIQ
jgi:hypothetical protein